MTLNSSSDWAEHLKHHWERRAASDLAEYFIAPHGFGDDDEWTEHGRRHATAALVGLETDWLSQRDILEIGCGAGRLAQFFVERTKSYTGLDIAPSMIERAQKRCGGAANARFFETDGLTVPAPARDRQYGLILSIAVMIHCPKPVIESLVRDAWSLLAPGGRLRIQVYADATDTDGLTAPPGAAPATAPTPRPDADASPPSTADELGSGDADPPNASEPPKNEPNRHQRSGHHPRPGSLPGEAELVDEHYMGYPFRYAEFAELMRELVPEPAQLYRDEPNCIYASILKPA
ncbi:MAG: class I SAM-dependent methyltransferase [bacterium]|nr:class I SAM-dependent methyltransferase [bacterium]